MAQRCCSVTTDIMLHFHFFTLLDFVTNLRLSWLKYHKLLLSNKKYCTSRKKDVLSDTFPDELRPFFLSFAWAWAAWAAAWQCHRDIIEISDMDDVVCLLEVEL
jgi:hypothetical protein